MAAMRRPLLLARLERLRNPSRVSGSKLATTGRCGPALCADPVTLIRAEWSSEGQRLGEPEPNLAQDPPFSRK
jgi:hypothetical protein